MYVRGYMQGNENGRVVTIEKASDHAYWLELRFRQ
jgi:hypothetical protein